MAVVAVPHVSRRGGYDKHDFAVTFADGEVYEGNLDCKHHTCEDPDIDVARHVRRFCQVHAGHFQPAGMSDRAWARFLARTKEDQQRYQDFLARHWIPDMPFEKSDAASCAR